ncbi:helix-turn-helix transcriptional regulator [Micromonospora sp. WMMD882]|uniref:helix-turn-helix domain-containing protein n=1 Tax=Micromonospora sp. WMMD882 TaxID=3015151 RepID=UPI00248B83DC|nr:helix-turn-helix transcriptional regulator [Micromonospora sp. WMMD882]WBB82093.1 helix-turn-helix transcriptional regulator [Micromonospora sp. WMMD882]
MSDVVDLDERWRDLGRQLAHLRSAAGLTQHTLAPLVHYGRSTIANVEVGRQRTPRRFWERCDEALETGGQLTNAYDQIIELRQQTARASPTGRVSGGQQADPIHPEPCEEQKLLRREFIATTAMLTVYGMVSAAPTGSRRINNHDVKEHAKRTARLRRLDNYLGGRDTLRLYEAELRATMTLLRAASFNEATAGALLALLAEQTQLAGWAAFDAGDHDYATALFSRSRSIAVQADDLPLAANALALLAYLRASLGQPDIDTAEASRVSSDSGVPANVQALLLERLAFTYAVAGREREAGHALDAAHDALGIAATDAAPDWATWVDHDEIRIMSGRVWSELRRPLRAAPELEETLRRFDDTYARDKALYSTWLADAYIYAGEAEHAALVLRQAELLSTGVASPRPATRIAAVRRRLVPSAQVRTAAPTIIT